jgi:hypothetical protein
MFGMMFSLAVFAAFFLFGGMVFAPAFLSAARFLFWWNVVFGVVFGGFAALTMLGVVSLSAAVPTAKARGFIGKMFGAAGGALVGGTFSLWAFAFIMWPRAMRIAGAFILTTAVVVSGLGYVWSLERVAIGFAMLLLPLMFGRA